MDPIWQHMDYKQLHLDGDMEEVVGKAKVCKVHPHGVGPHGVHGEQPFPYIELQCHFCNHVVQEHGNDGCDVELLE